MESRESFALLVPYMILQILYLISSIIIFIQILMFVNEW